MTYGVVPFENSTNGPVVYTLDLFADRQRLFPNVFVCGETYLAVHHYLLGHTPNTEGSGSITPTVHSLSSPTCSTTSPSSLNHIERVYSHPQAFGQCEEFLSTHLPDAERFEVSSTSKAAEIVAKNSSEDSAAIASRVAADVHSLNILASKIEDCDDNTTRFLILKKDAFDEKGLSINHLQASNEKALVSFTIDHSSPGALAEALLVFKQHRLNLTSITSRPSGESAWHYVFFVEFIGGSDGDGSVKKALQDLSNVATGWRWLGSWKLFEGI